MKIYVHGGLNKTGTSFLQSVLERNAKFLRDHGIAYCNSKSGYGNAADICFALRAGDIKRLRSLLNKHRIEAERWSCSSVLLSSELFYHDLIEPEKRSVFFRELALAQYETPKLLLFFRDPKDHAVSCYCHRSGTRNLEHFENWVRNTYEFPRELQSFLHAMACGIDMDVSIRAYTNKNIAMEMADWLGIRHFPDMTRAVENRSVNANEAKLLNWMYERDPLGAMAVRAALKSLNPEEKADDQRLRSHWRADAARSFVPLQDDLLSLERFAGMQLFSHGAVKSPGVMDEDGISLSETQVKTVISALFLLKWHKRLRWKVANLIRRCSALKFASVRRDSANDSIKNTEFLSCRFTKNDFRGIK